MKIFEFIKWELLVTKTRLIIKLKEIPKKEQKPIRKRIIRLAKVIKILDNFHVIEEVDFEGKGKKW